MGSLLGKRVLVLEDEPLVAIMLGEMLADAGCIVVGPAFNAEQALSLVEQNPIDAAILDINLGSGQTSAPVADALAEKAIPFLFATGYGCTAMRGRDQERVRIDKPYDASTIHDALRKCMKAAPG